MYSWYEIVSKSWISNHQIEQNSEKKIIKNKFQTKNCIKINSNFNFYKPYTLGSKEEEIKILQILLKNLGYYTWKITGIFDINTLQAVYKFQLENKLLTDDSPIYLKWYLWPATRKKLNQILSTMKCYE